MNAIIIFVAQLLFQLSRTYGQRVVSRDNVTSSVIVSTVVSSLWLITTYLGVKSLEDMNIPCIASYMVGGTLGTYLSFKIPIKESK
jgi:hypothetical protein